MSVRLNNGIVTLSGHDILRYGVLEFAKALWKGRKVNLSSSEAKNYCLTHQNSKLAKKIQSLSVKPTMNLVMSDIHFDKWQQVDKEFPWESTTILRRFVTDFSPALASGKLSMQKVAQQLKLFDLLIKQFENEVRVMDDVRDRYTGFQVADILRGNLVQTAHKLVKNVNELSFEYNGKDAASNSPLLSDLVKICHPDRAIIQMRSFMNTKNIDGYQAESDSAYKYFMQRRWVMDYESVGRYKELAQAVAENKNEALRLLGEQWLAESEKAFNYVHNELFSKKLRDSLQQDESLNAVEIDKKNSEALFVRTEIDGKLRWVDKDVEKTQQENTDVLKQQGKPERKIDAHELQKRSPIQTKMLLDSLVPCCIELGYKDGRLAKQLKEWLVLLNGQAAGNPNDLMHHIASSFMQQLNVSKKRVEEQLKIPRGE